MRRPFATFVLFAAFVTPAQGATFLYSGTIDNYVTPYSGIYAFTVAGAPGGSDGGHPGGGALISGDIFFAAGTSLSILAGQKGGSQNGDGGSGGSGGGMSFIAEGFTPIIVAGGGGGGGWSNGNGGPGLVGINGGGVGGGINGQGGTVFQSGAGWYSDGATALPPSTYYGTGGKSALSFAGGIGYVGGVPNPGPGANGGFGGGGGAGYNCGGGGGGYSGGGQLNPDGCARSGGGGGGSYISPDAFNVVATEGGNPAEYLMNGIYYSTQFNGYIILDEITGMPEPSTWGMLIVGFFGVGFHLRRQRPAVSAR